MSEVVEIERRKALIDQVVERFACKGCGRQIILHFNGGELDHAACCGYVYALEHGPIYLHILQIVD